MKLGESRKFTFVRSVLFSVCFIIYPLLSAGITDDQQTFVIAMNKDDLPCLQLAVLSFCGDSL